ncbi:MAG: polysaccharide biosynthesis protein [Nocardioidaceae bacterium]|nr:polysaccharide biosynthesis protein [Nocardioidaceae bacterium]
MSLQGLQRHRVALLMAFDAVMWIIALGVFAAVRWDLAGAPVRESGLAIACMFVVVVHLGLARVGRLHQGRVVIGSFDDSVLLGGVVATTGTLLTVVNSVLPTQLLPRTVPVAATFLALVLQAWGRVMWRRLRERDLERHDRSEAVPTLIMGAGDAGRQLLYSMLRDPSARYRPVGFLDDDPAKRLRRLRGLPVLGTGADLSKVVDETRAGLLVLAIPSAGAAVVRRMNRKAQRAGVEVKVLPGISELFDGRVGIADIRDIEVADLLGRHQVDTDVEAIADYLTGRRVLVTGAGGSIGSELCRQIDRYGPAELIMLDRDESALHAVQLSIHGRALLDSSDVVLGDIRDTKFLVDLFEERKPDVVFHAAALKHLPMLERYPGEAVKTNVWGTLSVLDAAKATEVERFVNISTDKAANPCSVLGYSKRIAEGLTAAAAEESKGTFVSVRFGNVLGSRGSVLTSFAAQIEAGGPVTVTDPDVTRYFMTVEEAVQLVIQAAAIGRDGEALVLEMGQPVRIADVARQMITLADSDARIVFTGLRDGEKLHEDLFADDEPDERPVHPQVSHVGVPPVREHDVSPLDVWAHRDQLVRSLARTCERMTVRTARLRDLPT